MHQAFGSGLSEALPHPFFARLSLQIESVRTRLIFGAFMRLSPLYICLLGYRPHKFILKKGFPKVQRAPAEWLEPFCLQQAKAGFLGGNDLHEGNRRFEGICSRSVQYTGPFGTLVLVPCGSVATVCRTRDFSLQMSADRLWIRDDRIATVRNGTLKLLKTFVPFRRV